MELTCKINWLNKIHVALLAGLWLVAGSAWGQTTDPFSTTSPASASMTTKVGARVAPSIENAAQELAASGLEFYPMTPCRLVDTRGAAAGFNGIAPFSGPSIAAGETITIPVQSAAEAIANTEPAPCGVIPSTAQAYSFNLTVVPHSGGAVNAGGGAVDYVSLWAAGATQPYVATLDDPEGLIVDNAAIVPAGSPSGGINVYNSGPTTTDIVIDMNGYFAPPSTGLQFFPVTPCRLVDTRGAAANFNGIAPFSGPSLAAQGTMTIPVQSAAEALADTTPAPCGAIPSTAQAYSFNLTVVPHDGAVDYVTLWPSGLAKPFVATLDDPQGEIVDNAAIVPAGTSSGGVNVYNSGPSAADIVIDMNGYFATPTSLQFYPVAPCRLVDTRGAAAGFNGIAPFSGPSIPSESTVTIPVQSAAEALANTMPAPCGVIPSTAQAYSFNLTVVPHDGAVDYVTLWPSGLARPFVATLDDPQGQIVDNAAMVPAGTSGGVNVYNSGPTATDIVIDMNGYFAPPTVVVAAPVITSATSAGGPTGTAFTYQIVATNSPTSYSATGLPAGLSINTGTGLISGTPTSVGVSTVTLGAANGIGTGNANLTLTIAPAPSDPLSPLYEPAIDTNPGDYPSNIWITGSLAKVLQNSGTPGAVHWAVVYTMQNEIQSFQVHVNNSGTGAINALNVTMSDLVNARTGTHISAASTDIVVYREAYENVNFPTATGVTFLNTTGPIPDILIPAIDPYWHQTTNAFPFIVLPGNNQSVWIDVHTPPSAPSGYYSGTVTVSNGATVLATMPVVYAVWDWAMPSTASLPSFTSASYGGFCYQVYGGGCSAYPGSLGESDYGETWTDVDAAVQMLDNRYSLAGITNVFPGAGSFATFDSVYGPLFNGTPGHITGILQGARLTSYEIVPLSTQFNAATFQNFQNHFAANGWPAPFYSLWDEPNPYDPSVWATLIANGNLEHTFSNPIIPNEVTTDIVTAGNYGALNTIDWLVVNLVVLEPSYGAPMQDLSTYQNWLTGNPIRRFWAYQGCSDAGTCTNGISGPEYPSSPNSYPNYDIDGTPVANRVLEWLTYLHGQTGELYYYIDICDGAASAGQCGYPGVSPANPLISDYYAGGWGDGTLMYPGSSAYVGTAIPIWLPSMRLKMIRDGMQDYEYLNALTNLGQGAFAAQQAYSFITNSYTFSNDPAALEASRQAMGTMLHQLMLAK